MKSKQRLHLNNTIIIVVITLFIVIALFATLIPNNARSSNMTGSFSVFKESSHEKNFVWKIGEKTYSYEEFDPCSEGNVIEYIISDTEPENFSDFPSGIAKGYPCFPSEIYLRFSVNQNHVKNSLYMNVIGTGNVIIYFDEVFIKTIEIDSGFGWEECNILFPPILPDEHFISLEIEDEEEYLLFDCLWFIGYPDTDQDGVCDLDEGTGDSDGDGLEDYLDEDCAFIPDSEGEKILLMVRKKDDPEFPSIPVLREVSLKDNPSSIQGPVDGPTDIEFLYGFVSGRIDNLEKGQEVELIFSPPQSIDLYEIEQIWIHNEREGSWVFQDSSLDKENRRFHILLKDGNPEDTDGKTDAHIGFNLGLGIPIRFTPYSLGSCFLGSMKFGIDEVKNDSEH